MPFPLLYPCLNLTLLPECGRGVTGIGFGPQFSGRCLGTGVTGNRKDFCKYITSQRDIKENMEKAEVLHVFFTLVFIGRICLLESQALETSGKVWSNEDLVSVEKDQVREHLKKFAVRKSMGTEKCIYEQSENRYRSKSTLNWF